MVPELYQRACTAAQSGDMALSVSLLRQFAETKADTMFHAFARFHIGTALLDGVGVPADKTAGFRELLAGAEAGDPRAMNAVAVCYELGTGTEIDWKAADFWYSRAVECGDQCAVRNQNLFLGKNLSGGLFI